MEMDPQKIADQAIQKLENFVNKPLKKPSSPPTQVEFPSTSKVKQELENKPLLNPQARNFITEKLKPLGGALLVIGGSAIFVSALPVTVPLGILGATIGFVGGHIASKAGFAPNASRLGALAGAMIGPLFSVGIVILGLNLMREKTIKTPQVTDDKIDMIQKAVEEKKVTFDSEVREIPKKPVKAERVSSADLTKNEISFPLIEEPKNPHIRLPVDYVEDIDAFMEDQFKLHEDYQHDIGMKEEYTILNIPLFQEKVNIPKSTLNDYFSDRLRDHNIIQKQKSADVTNLKENGKKDNFQDILDALASDFEIHDAVRESFDKSIFYQGIMTNKQVESIIAHTEGGVVFLHFDPEVNSMILSCKYDDGTFEHIAAADENFEMIKDTFHDLGWAFLVNQDKADLVEYEIFGQQKKHELKNNMLYHGVLSVAQVENQLADLAEGIIIVHYVPLEMDIVFSYKMDGEMNHLPIGENDFEALKKEFMDMGYKFVSSKALMSKISDLRDEFLHTKMTMKKVEKRLSEKSIIIWQDKKTEKIMISFRDEKKVHHVKGSEFEKTHRVNLENTGYKFLARKM
jgi:hypothetical protein